MSFPNVKIFVVTHRRPVKISGDPGYIPFQGGRAFTSERFAEFGDDMGNNIAHLNPSFSENSTIYWMCNNREGKAEFMGLSHFRRFFAPKSLCSIIDGHPVASSADFGELYEGDVDLVVAQPLTLINSKTDQFVSVEENYFGCHVGFDLFLVRQVLRSLARDYLEAFDFVMRNGQLVPYNMFVGRRCVIEDYAEWVFPILMDLDARIPYKVYEDPYQRRAIGFLSERLFTVWIVQNRYRVKVGYRHATFNADV